MKKKSWNEFTGCQRAAIVALALTQFGLLAAALWDVAHRKAEEVRGPRAMWAALSFIDFIGPIAYFTIGRKGCCCPWCCQSSEETVTLEGDPGDSAGPADR